MDEKLNKPEPKRIRLLSVAEINDEDIVMASSLPVTIVEDESMGEFEPNNQARLDKTKIAGTIQK